MRSPKVGSCRLFESGLPGLRTFIGILVVASVSFASWAAPVVTNVEAGQRTDGSKLVDVLYDLAGGVEPMTVTVTFSTDDGATFSIVPLDEHLSGDVGPGIGNGTGKHIVWDAGTDQPGIFASLARAKVIATEGGVGGETLTITLPEGVALEVILIPAGSFEMGSPDAERSRSGAEGPDHTVTFGYSFQMGKTAVTQEQWLVLMGSWPGTVLIPPITFHGTTLRTSSRRSIRTSTVRDRGRPRSGSPARLNGNTAAGRGRQRGFTSVIRSNARTIAPIAREQTDFARITCGIAATMRPPGRRRVG